MICPDCEGSGADWSSFLCRGLTCRLCRGKGHVGLCMWLRRRGRKPKRQSATTTQDGWEKIKSPRKIGVNDGRDGVRMRL